MEIRHRSANRMIRMIETIVLRIYEREFETIYSKQFIVNTGLEWSPELAIEGNGTDESRKKQMIKDYL